MHTLCIALVLPVTDMKIRMPARGEYPAGPEMMHRTPQKANGHRPRASWAVTGIIMVQFTPGGHFLLDLCYHSNQ